jgi:hypothetical protein
MYIHSDVRSGTEDRHGVVVVEVDDELRDEQFVAAVKGLKKISKSICTNVQLLA